MSKTIMQVPLDTALRDQATAAATDMGFSSLQESVRVFLKQLATRSIQVRFEPKHVQLSKKAIKRYDKMSDEIKAGKNIIRTTSLDDFFNKLDA